MPVMGRYKENLLVYFMGRYKGGGVDEVRSKTVKEGDGFFFCVIFWRAIVCICHSFANVAHFVFVRDV
jgi:hypothetical protein